MGTIQAALRPTRARCLESGRMCALQRRRRPEANPAFLAHQLGSPDCGYIPGRSGSFELLFRWSRFLARDEVVELCRYREGVVREAIGMSPKLAIALSVVSQAGCTTRSRPATESHGGRAPASTLDDYSSVRYGGPRAHGGRDASPLDERCSACEGWIRPMRTRLPTLLDEGLDALVAW